MASQSALDSVLKRVKEEKINLIKFQWLGKIPFLHFGGGNLQLLHKAQ
jgi:hypothetical protein